MRASAIYDAVTRWGLAFGSTPATPGQNAMFAFSTD
jgi:hypothetical protein